MNFKIITTQRNSAVWLPECINSLASQLGESFKFMDEVLVLARPPKVPHV